MSPINRVTIGLAVLCWLAIALVVILALNLF